MYGTLPANYTISFFEELNLIISSYEDYKKDLFRFVLVDDATGSLRYVPSTHLDIVKVSDMHLEEIKTLKRNSTVKDFEKILNAFKSLIIAQSKAVKYL